MSTSYFKTYLNSIDQDKAELKQAVIDTRDRFRENVLDNFDDISDRQVLLYGDVQSGKTSHMLGVIADALDAHFQTVIVLTSSNVRLVKQTFKRIFMSLPGALVCGRDDTNNYRMNLERSEPQRAVVVLGKEARTLSKWLNAFESTSSLQGNPVLIVDDEADATSLNTLVNKGEVSSINQKLTKIRQLSTGCIYLQVTGTPQAILLQSEQSGWHIEKAVHFLPGEGYIGGDLFFEEFPNPYTRPFPGDEESESRHMQDAVLTHLVTSACFKLRGWPTCNMLLHPSHLTEVHFDYKSEVREIVDRFYKETSAIEQENLLEPVCSQLRETYPKVPDVEEVVQTLLTMKDEFNYLAVNNDEKSTEEDWRSGYNFIVGGNSLGRGLTFGFLQTVFYIRESSRPQADTLWQHARMFGYERHKPTLRVFLPAHLAKTFQEVHKGNEIIKEQLARGVDVRDLRVVLNGHVKPTRDNVLNKKLVGKLSGGVNYFAENPVIEDFQELDEKLNELIAKNGYDFEVSAKAAAKLTRYFKTETDDLDLATFRVALEHYSASKPHITARIVLRTGRKVNRGTGTLLSPDDRKLSSNETIHPLLVIYRIEGVNDPSKDPEKNWSSDPIWVPNIMIPERRQFWRVDG
ncbi:DEAD/DEAH box helicase [Corynebacterium sanguinis]|uniref:Z1 domain-containing protein n=1 Tax=Corynebacterium sanguinis TaxID=2594913 RepID=UPI00223AC419|nr:Z1 domain-containing protein [Corynebacterium sanguinis]MCT1627808.1 DEAD/DEAH box helicase [Corynebacterium sanguinis]